MARRPSTIDGPLAADLQPDERRARLDLGALDEKPAAPGADLELDPVARARASRSVDALALGQARGVVRRGEACAGLLPRSEPEGRGSDHGAVRVSDRPRVPRPRARRLPRRGAPGSGAPSRTVPSSLAVGVRRRSARSAPCSRRSATPAATLDDAYIHFQYARAIAEGHPLRFQAGEPLTSGATSLLWPALLAPFWALGVRDEAIVWPAWALSFAALGALAWEASALRALAGRAAAVGAAAMVLAFGGFVWCAASGMEVVPFAWAHRARGAARERVGRGRARARRTRRRAASSSRSRGSRRSSGPRARSRRSSSRRRSRSFPRQPTRGASARARARGRSRAVVALPLLLWALTGSPREQHGRREAAARQPVLRRARARRDGRRRTRSLLVGTLLNGEVWSAEFLPHGGAPVAMAGLGAIAVLGWRATRLAWRAAAVLLHRARRCSRRASTTRSSGTACATSGRSRPGGSSASRASRASLGDARRRGPAALARRRRRSLCGAFVGLLRVQARVGHRRRRAVRERDRPPAGRARALGEGDPPPDARIGVNDTAPSRTSASAARSTSSASRREGEARYWVAGAGSRLEHYERLRATRPVDAADALHRLPGVDGHATRPRRAAPRGDRDRLDDPRRRRRCARTWPTGRSSAAGEKPWTPTGGDVVDALDVADLESEASHEYELLGAREGEEVAHEGISPDGATVVDGGRTRRTRRALRRVPAAGVAGARHRAPRRPGRARASHVIANERPVGDLRARRRRGLDGARRSRSRASSGRGPSTIELRAAGGADHHVPLLVRRRE